MKPETSQQPMVGPEQLPMPPVQMGGEYIPSLPPLERRGERSAERHEQAAEAAAAASDAVGMPSVAVPSAAPVAVPVPVSAVSPATAADEDLIEKEWVDKSKEIIAATRNDPHARTDQVNQLQRDYLQKRYGKVLGAQQQ